MGYTRLDPVRSSFYVKMDPVKHLPGVFLVKPELGVIIADIYIIKAVLAVVGDSSDPSLQLTH